MMTLRLGKETLLINLTLRFATRLPAEPPTSIQLSGREVCNVPANGQTLRVASGCAWVSSNRENIVVRCGEIIQLHKGKHPAVISALGQQPLVCELR